MVVRGLYMSTNLQAKVSRWLHLVQFWLLPGTCIACRKPSDRSFDLCAGCEAGLARIDLPCRGCALPLPPGRHQSRLCGTCLRPRRPIRQMVAGFAYEDPVRTLIGHFKYHGKLQHGRVLTTLLEAAIREYYADSPLPQLLLPVPLHTSRLRERGFNQAMLMARQLGKSFAIPVAPQVLQRQRRTPPQQGLSARERKRNLRAAFGIEHGASLDDIHCVALIDDVVTTMSTVSALARLLHRHCDHPLTVHVWCLARA